MYAASYVWARVLGHVAQQLGDIMVTAWFDDAEVVKYTDTELVVHSPTEFRQEKLRALYRGRAAAAVPVQCEAGGMGQQ